MYPTVNIGSWLSIYTFGLFMVLAWAIFFILLHYFAIRRGFSKHIFTNIIEFTLSIFFFGRIFYIFSDWRTEQFLFVDLFESGNIVAFLKDFFITDNYSLSFAGGVVGFLIIFLYKTWNTPKERPRYWDVIIPSFLIASVLGYLGALLGGQIYGIVFDSPISITYDNYDSIVPFQNPTFPLPIMYIFLAIVTIVFIYRLESKMIVPEGFVGFMGMGIFGITLFLGEFLNGASDLFSSRIFLNLTQVIALTLISYAFIGLMKIIKS